VLKPGKVARQLSSIEGHGNSNSLKSYDFVNKNVMCGKHYFRLKQIDNDAVLIDAMLETGAELFFVTLNLPGVEILLPDESGIRMTFHPCETQTMLWWMFIL